MSVILENVDSPGTAISLNNGNWVTVAANVSVSGEDGAIFASDGAFGSYITLAPGAVAATYGSGTAIALTTSNPTLPSHVTVSRNAAVFGDTGLSIVSSVPNPFSPTAVLQNSGSVYGSGFGIALVGGDSTLMNSGVIEAAPDRVGVAISLEEAAAAVTNSHIISGSVGVQLTNGSHLEITNTGSIVGTVQGVAILDGYAGIVNSGSIVIQGTGNAVEGYADLNNSGTISGTLRMTETSSLANSGSVIGLVEAGEVVNRGDIQHHVSLLGDGRYDGRGGTVGGPVLGGDGNDTILTDQMDVEIDGGDGYDTAHIWAMPDRLDNIEHVVLRGDADLTFEGGAGGETVRGNFGDNHLLGNGGRDTLSGASGDDRIDGGTGADHLKGGAGDDMLFGAGGRDRMAGGQGNDTLLPGAGRDVITTGAGEDVIAFNTFAELSGDRVTDFTPGVDVIDVSGIGALSFIGTDAFTGTAMELRLRETATGNTLVQLDRDGDGVTDAHIVLVSTNGLCETDFVF